MQYFITQSGPKDFMVAKFGDKKAPFDVYNITRERCDCPSPRLPCKHVLLVRKWLKLDVPAHYYFDDEEDAFIKHSFVGSNAERFLEGVLPTDTKKETSRG